MDYGTNLTTHQITSLQSVLQLVQTCQVDDPHTQQVTKLALKIFDSTIDLHHLGYPERFILLCSSLLHDVGWVDGWKNHHKATLRIILSAPILRLSAKERLLIGSIARYHRGALPLAKHDHYAAINPVDKEKVLMLAGILRLADGLDASHQQRITQLMVETTKKKVILHCSINAELVEELDQLADKACLFIETFKHKVEINTILETS
jgi:exopolyphosphatase/guanosine-5'-triphosphate,3'-diphosphate pyrophosphatase